MSTIKKQNGSPSLLGRITGGFSGFFTGVFKGFTRPFGAFENPIGLVIVAGVCLLTWGAPNFLASLYYGLRGAYYGGRAGEFIEGAKIVNKATPFVIVNSIDEDQHKENMKEVEQRILELDQRRSEERERSAAANQQGAVAKTQNSEMKRDAEISTATRNSNKTVEMGPSFTTKQAYSKPAPTGGKTYIPSQSQLQQARKKLRTSQTSIENKAQEMAPKDKPPIPPKKRK